MRGQSCPHLWVSKVLELRSSKALDIHIIFFNEHSPSSPFYAGSPVSLFCLLPFFLLPFLFGRFSLLPKPFLFPPLREALALTIHKSQGITIPKAYTNIGKSERTAGTTYVALSRVKTLSSCVIEPKTFERIANVSSSVNFKYRLQEEQRLNGLAQATYFACQQ